MTSWNRGRENEEIGERQLSDNDASNNLEGVGRKVGGEVEQGIDNVGDTLSGKQDDLQGKERNREVEAREWVENRGEDARDAADKAGDWAENRGEDLDRATDRAGDWVQERGEDVKRKVD